MIMRDAEVRRARSSNVTSAHAGATGPNRAMPAIGGFHPVAVILLLCAALITAGAGRAWGAPRQDEGGAAATAAEEGAPAGATDDAAERWLAVRGGIVHTVSGPVLRDVTILCRGTRIAAIGRGIEIPDGAEIIDATGHRIYPGLVAVRSSGLVGADPPEETTDAFSLAAVTALAGGVTTVFSGSGAYKVAYRSIDDMVVRKDLHVPLAYGTRDPQGRRRLRENFDRLRRHQQEVEAWERRRRDEPDAKKPDEAWIRGDLARYRALLRGEAVAVFTADRVHDLLQVVDFVEQYGIRAVVVGATEGWIVAPELSRARVGVIVTPRARQDADERLNRENGSNIENAAILHRTGVPVAIIPSQTGVSFGGLGGRDLLHLRLEAAFGVRGGLSNDAALRAITLDAARILGIDDRVGSIEVGKDADLIVADGDILHYATHARWTIVNGRVAYDKQTEGIFDHIRPDGDWDAPPPADHWPRRLGMPW